MLFVYQILSSLLGFTAQANSWAGRSNDEAYKQTDPLWFCVQFFILIPCFTMFVLRKGKFCHLRGNYNIRRFPRAQFAIVLIFSPFHYCVILFTLV